ncbi:unnamed protein product [Paramecium sonneborni]|uniref:Uncharacterized protein n=1 Tax=Paramecium sonneborni TaxID=65129 RepID=A0A8S1MR40_9CILI|nr:unnamed protein product [Paramecium sonneborni]
MGRIEKGYKKMSNLMKRDQEKENKLEQMPIFIQFSGYVIFRATY